MTLLERRTTGVRLNQEGRRLLEHTTSLFRNINRMLHDLSPGRTTERWVLEIGVCPSISRTFALERFLPLFDLDSIALRIRNGRYEPRLKKALTAFQRCTRLACATWRTGIAQFRAHGRTFCNAQVSSPGQALRAASRPCIRRRSRAPERCRSSCNEVRLHCGSSP